MSKAAPKSSKAASHFSLEIIRGGISVELKTGNAKTQCFILPLPVAYKLSADLLQFVERARAIESNSLPVGGMSYATKAKIDTVGLVSGDVVLSLVDEAGAKVNYRVDTESARGMATLLLQYLPEID